MGHPSARKSGEMPVMDPRDDVRGELAADLDADPGHSQFDSRTPVVFLVSQLSPVFSLFTSFASVRAAVCFDASFLTDRAVAFLTTHAVGTGFLRKRYGGGSHCGGDRDDVEQSHKKLLCMDR
jgi:hypothetical protein